MSATEPKKLPTLRDSKSPEQLDIFQRDVREIIRRLREDYEAADVDLQTELDALEADVGGLVTGVSSVTAGSTMVTASPTTGAVVVDVVPANFTGIPESGVSGLVSDLAARPTGSGTTNKIAKWTSSTALGDSSITDTGVLVTVANPLTVTGAGTFQSTLSATGNFAVNTSKFTVAASTGNTVVAGTFNGQGAADFDSTVNVDGNLTLSTFTLGSVLFAGTGGLVSQNNSKLFWDNTNFRLGIGNAAPAQALHVTGTARATTGLIVDTMTSGSVWFAGSSGTLTQNNANFYWDNTNSRLGVGSGISAAPTNPISVKGPGVSDMVSIQNTNNAQWSTYVARDDGGTVRTAFGYGNALTPDTPRNSRAHWWAESGTDFVIMKGGSVPGTQLMYITSGTGNVNIGATLGDPGVKLRVEGTFGATGQGMFGATSGPTISTFGGGLEVTRDSASSVIISSSYGTGVTPQIQMHRGRGSAASHSAVLSGDILGQIGFTGMRDPFINTITSSFIRVTTTQDWDATFAGSKIEFTTTPNSGSANRAVHFTIEGDGGISLLNSSGAAVSAASQVTLRANTQLQVSENTGAYVTVAKGTGTANRVTKWSNTTGLLADSLVSDDGTTFAINTNKFTVTEASGNTSVAGTLGVTGLTTLTGGFSLGADSSAASHKITNLTNGSAAQDAAAFGQIATAVNAAVSGTTNTLAKFTGTNVVGNSSITDNGTTITAAVATVINAAATLGLDVENVRSAATGNSNAGQFSQSGTFDTTGAARTSRGLYVSSTGTRSAGSNDLTNIGIEVTAASGQKNVALQAYAGDVFLNALNGNTGIGFSPGSSLAAQLDVNGTLHVLSTATLDGNVTVAGALTGNGNCTLGDGSGDTLKFYGGTGATQQTITGSRGGNAALADLLTKLATLGLIVDSTS